MFDALLGKKFTVKCKHAIKCINERLRPIRNRKQAVVNILRKDAAELLRNGGDAQAFSRMDELIVEMNRLACYDMIDSFCQIIYKQLPVLQKQSDCPPEDQESVATLIFAAARFSDLPELCNLRSAFTMRYGNSLEGFVNSEFKEKVGTKSFPSSKKIQLMEDIAYEFSVLWNPNSFNHRNPSAPSRNPHAKENGISGAISNARAVKQEEETVKRTTTTKLRVPESENKNPSPAIAFAPLAKPREENAQKKIDADIRTPQPFQPRDAAASHSQPPVSVRKSTRAQPRVSSEPTTAKVGPKFDHRSTLEKGTEEPERDVDHRWSSRDQTAAASADGPPKATKEHGLRMVPPPYVKSIGPKVEPWAKTTASTTARETVVEAAAGKVNREAQVNEQRPKARSVRKKPLQEEQSRVAQKAEVEDRIDFDFESDDVDQLLVFYSKKRTAGAGRRPESKGKEQVNGGEVDELAERFTRLKGGRNG
ncbi:uncharacterized protein LOC144702566 [Wolffia australiana]